MMSSFTFMSRIGSRSMTTLEAGHLEQIEQTYLPVLTQLTATLTDSRDKEKLLNEFGTITLPASIDPTVAKHQALLYYSCAYKKSSETHAAASCPKAMAVLQSPFG